MVIFSKTRKEVDLLILFTSLACESVNQQLKKYETLILGQALFWSYIGRIVIVVFELQGTILLFYLDERRKKKNYKVLKSV